MENKPKFMSGRWQRNLLRDHPLAFWVLCFALTFPLLFLMRVGFKGELGSLVQIALRVFAAILAVGLLWLIIEVRKTRKHQSTRIDAYLEQRYEQTHEKNPPSA